MITTVVCDPDSDMLKHRVVEHSAQYGIDVIALGNCLRIIAAERPD